MLFSCCFILVCLALCGADITGTNPPANSCMCLDSTGVNVRSTPCGTVIGSANTPQCFLYKGGNQYCTLSGVQYHFFEVDYFGQSGWIAGLYLVMGGTGDPCPGDPGDFPDKELRAAFMATAWNIDWPTSAADSVATQQTHMINYLNMMRDTNMNAVMFQIRPVGDAFYNSPLEPWSRYLTGTQGQAPSPLWDPLQFTVQEAHSRNIEVHVWLNPYRANLASNTNGMASSHMCLRMPQYCHAYSSYMWMDPGAGPVVDHLVDVISDVVTRYDIDGVQFDDYFYPYPDGNQFPDTNTWNSYLGSCGGACMSRDDWRRDNVNRMVQRVYNQIKSIKGQVKFSISPFGIYRPCNANGMPCSITGLDPYTALYADAKLWLQQGWLDFIAPQLYWEIDPPAQSYPVLLDWWVGANTRDRHIYAANGVYKLEDNNWPVSEITEQVAISRQRAAGLSLGNIYYSIKYFRDNYKNIRTIFQSSVYPNVATPPEMPWLSPKVPDSPIDVKVSGNTVRWQASAVDVPNIRSWIVYRREEGKKWQIDRILPVSATNQIELQSGRYAIRAMDRASVESEPVYVTI